MSEKAEEVAHGAETNDEGEGQAKADAKPKPPPRVRRRRRRGGSPRRRFTVFSNWPGPDVFDVTCVADADSGSMVGDWARKSLFFFSEGGRVGATPTQSLICIFWQLKIKMYMC